MNVDTPLHLVDCSAKGSAKRVGVLEGPVCIRARTAVEARRLLTFRISEISLYLYAVLKIVAIADRASILSAPRSVPHGCR